MDRLSKALGINWCQWCDKEVTHVGSGGDQPLATLWHGEPGQEYNIYIYHRPEDNHHYYNVYGRDLSPQYLLIGKYER